MAYSPITKLKSFRHYIGQMTQSCDPLYFTVINNQTQQAIGTLSLMRITPEHGIIEVGHVFFSHRLQKTVMVTEAHYLLMKEVFEVLQYRRYEWKCDNLNTASKKAAERLGFKFEGVFRQHIVYKNRNRDTAWYSIIDKEWHNIKTALEQFLAKSNFDKQGQQIKKLTIETK